MALEVRYRKLEDLIPYARNSRTHSEAQVAQIASSIREFGFTNPIKRWQEFTGKQAVLEADDRTFDEVMNGCTTTQ